MAMPLWRRHPGAWSGSARAVRASPGGHPCCPSNRAGETNESNPRHTTSSVLFIWIYPHPTSVFRYDPEPFL